MTAPVIAALMSIISSPDIAEVNTLYRGRVSTFNATCNASLFQAARSEDRSLRLPMMHYCACRWDYRSLRQQLDADTRTEVKQTLYHDYIVEVSRPEGGKILHLRPVDWGPARWTGRIIDIDIISMRELDLDTDDEVIIRLRKRR